MRPFLLFLCLFSVLPACAKHVDVTIRNPLGVGTIDQPNTIVAESSRRRGLGIDPFRSSPLRATLVGVGVDSVCFDLKAAAESPGAPPTARLADLKPMMRADGMTNGRWRRDAVVRDVVSEAYTRPGRVPVNIQQGSQSYCAARSYSGRCDRIESMPTYVTRWVPGVVHGTRLSGQVCFPNDGRVEPTTERLILRAGGRLFRWGLTGNTPEVQRHGKQKLLVPSRQQAAAVEYGTATD